MTFRFFRRLISSALIIAALSGCSTIKGWFPDKERDYQFTTEIPDLVIPDDLKGKAMTKPTTVAIAPVEPESPAIAEPVVAAVAETPAKPELPRVTTNKTAPVFEPKSDEPLTKLTDEQQAPVASQPGGDYSSLQIDQPLKQAWRLVGRGLTRNHVEIIDRNAEKAYYFVKYDPNAAKIEDGSLWDEVTFLFSDGPEQEQEFRVALEALGALNTEVSIQDGTGKKLSGAAATHLLRMITEAINQDSAQ